MNPSQNLEDLLVLETERTYLRKWTSHDLENLSLIFGDPQVMANVGEGKAYDPEQIAKLLLFFLNHYKEHGFGPWAVIDKRTLEVIGINGIKYLSGFSHVDLGFAFLKKEWGKGLAFETSVAILDFAKKTYHLKNFGANVSPNNLVSIGLLEKLGMTYKETVSRNSVPTKIFTMDLE